MKKIALVSPMILPVPAVKGGAVETLTTFIVEENEKKKELEIDLYTIFNPKIKDISFAYTNIISIRTNLLQKFYQKMINAFYKVTGQAKGYHSSWGQVAKQISKKHYDGIVVENNMFLYRLIQKRTKDTLIYHMHNDFNQFDKTPQNCQVIANTAEKIITVSQYIKDSVNKKVKTDKVEVLYNALDLDVFNEKNVVDYRKKYQIAPTDMVVGFVGRITPEKGILELVQALKNVHTEKKVKLVVVGSQWYDSLKEDDYVKRIIEESENIKENIVFTGYMSADQMPSIYAMLDIVVVPSLCQEAFGCVAIESMAMGKPLIVAKSGGLPEIAKENYSFVIPTDENFVKQMTEKLQILIENDEMRIQFGKEAKKEFAQNEQYHKDTYYNRFLKLLE